MSLFGGVGGRLALALLTVVIGVLVIVYLIVVPSYQHALQASEIKSLETAMRGVAIKEFPSQPVQQQPYASRIAPRVDARVVVYSILDANPARLSIRADSQQDTSVTDVENDSVALLAFRRSTPQHGVVEGPDGSHYAEVAFPIAKSYVVLLRSSLHDQFEAVGVVRRRVLIAASLATAFALLLGFGGARLFARRIRRLEEAAERIATGDFDAPVVDHGTDELGQLARAFERMRLRLASLDRARGEFIANASHELRTPLFSLGGFLELLDDPELDEPTRLEFLAKMREQLDRLTRLATNLLDLSRLDAGRLTVQREVIDLVELADQLEDEVRPRAEALDHPLHVETPLVPVAALADSERVLQIGRILLENAFLHTPPGTVVRLGVGHEGGRATLAVANDGPPIPADSQEQIFARFYRLTTTVASGSGLGLAIARELATVMGGRIELESAPGRTVFTLVLRAEAVDRSLAGSFHRESVRNRLSTGIGSTRVEWSGVTKIRQNSPGLSAPIGGNESVVMGRGSSGTVRAVRLTFPAKAEFITLGRLALTGVARLAASPFSDEVLGDLKLALTEACTNSVRHAYDGNAGAVSITYELHRDRLVIEVADEGAGFDRGGGRVDPEDELNEGGLGIAIIEALTDELEIGRGAAGGSRLRFVKRLD
jgi:signal transduction histidine kinase/anti-sigma regulatory factor (Ser/Thr protein kinase)